MDRRLLAAAAACRRDRRAFVIVTELPAGTSRLVAEEEAAADPLGPDIVRALQSGRSQVIAREGGETFLAVDLPPPRLIAIGAVHISQGLVPLCRLTGFELIVVDPRSAFATAERFAGVTLHADWPESVLPGLGLDPHTALAALTHDPKIDEWPLAAALGAGCFYVGALGSRRTHARRLERLAERGVAAAALDRIHAPIGLDIGAANPAEIAVAVMAEVISAYRKRGTGQESPA